MLDSRFRDTYVIICIITCVMQTKESKKAVILVIDQYSKCHSPLKFKKSKRTMSIYLIKLISSSIFNWYLTYHKKF